VQALAHRPRSHLSKTVPSSRTPPAGLLGTVRTLPPINDYGTLFVFMLTTPHTHMPNHASVYRLVSVKVSACCIHGTARHRIISGAAVWRFATQHQSAFHVICLERPRRILWRLHQCPSWETFKVAYCHPDSVNALPITGLSSKYSKIIPASSSERRSCRGWPEDPACSAKWQESQQNNPRKVESYMEDTHTMWNMANGMA
jgi:hypothetical protein